MSQDKKIRVCLKCRKYMILNDTAENKQKLTRFDSDHNKHTLITTSYTEIDNLECGKVHCEDDDPRKKVDYVK